ncbi:MAG: OmpA family protein [Chitinophagales bacterium]
MKHLLTLLILFTALHAGSVLAKENKDLMKANYYYNHFAFHEAIPFYEKIANQVNDPVIYTQLGDCYRLTGNLDKAAAWYDKAVKIKGCNIAVMLRYGQVLMQLTQYSEAEKWLKGYQKNYKTDRRVANLISGCSYAQKIQKEIPSGVTSLPGFNTDGAEFAPALWKDRLVFTSDTVIDLKKKTDNWTGNAYYNIYSVSCDNKGNCGTDISLVTDAKKLNIKYHNGPCTFSADGKQMYYTRSKYNDKFFSHKSISNKDSVVLLEIMIATGYDEKDKEFKEIIPFEYNSDDYSVAHPTVSTNGKYLVFSSNMPKGAGGSDLYICKKTGTKWGKPQSVGNIINTEGEEVFPYWADDNTLYFSSDGHEGLGGLDIYRSHWDEKLNTFSTPENVGMPINSSYDDISLAMFADGRSTYFSSNRPAVKGGDNIYFYKREKVFLQVNITDSMTQQPLTDIKISLNAAKDNRELTIDKNTGLFTRLYPEIQYSVQASKAGYDPKQLSIATTNIKEVDTITWNVALYSKPVVHDTTPPPPPIPSFTKVVGTPEVNKVYEIGHFYFAFNSAVLSDTAKLGLDSLAEYLVHNPKMSIQVRAHTDCRGGDAYNMKLSKQRAAAVAGYLKRKGIAPSRLESVGLGSRNPVVKCPICEKCTEEQHFLNRVLEFKILHL